MLWLPHSSQSALTSWPFMPVTDPVCQNHPSIRPSKLMPGEVPPHKPFHRKVLFLMVTQATILKSAWMQKEIYITWTYRWMWSSGAGIFIRISRIFKCDETNFESDAMILITFDKLLGAYKMWSITGGYGAQNTQNKVPWNTGKKK